MQNRILILFAHPLFERSRVHKSLVDHIPDGITFHDLYEAYPDFNLDINKEKALLLDHDLIIWEHPLYWYSCPAILKQWIDVVLEAGWAYGNGGVALKGKSIFQVVSTGGGQATYLPDGFHHATLTEFLLPFKRTAELCHMDYLPPFVVHGTHRLTPGEIRSHAEDYQVLLERLKTYNPGFETLKKHQYLNHWLTENE